MDNYFFRNAVHCRMRAAAVRAMAERAEQPRMREILVDLAQDYERMAARAEARLNEPVPADAGDCPEMQRQQTGAQGAAMDGAASPSDTAGFPVPPDYIA